MGLNKTSIRNFTFAVQTLKTFATIKTVQPYTKHSVASITPVPADERAFMMKNALTNQLWPEDFGYIQENSYAYESRMLGLVAGILLLLISCCMLCSVYQSHRRANKHRNVVAAL